MEPVYLRCFGQAMLRPQTPPAPPMDEELPRVEAALQETLRRVRVARRLLGKHSLPRCRRRSCTLRVQLMQRYSHVDGALRPTPVSDELFLLFCHDNRLFSRVPDVDVLKAYHAAVGAGGGMDEKQCAVAVSALLRMQFERAQVCACPMMAFAVLTVASARIE